MLTGRPQLLRTLRKPFIRPAKADPANRDDPQRERYTDEVNDVEAGAAATAYAAPSSPPKASKYRFRYDEPTPEQPGRAARPARGSVSPTPTGRTAREGDQTADAGFFEEAPDAPTPLHQDPRHREHTPAAAAAAPAPAPAPAVESKLEGGERRQSARKQPDSPPDAGTGSAVGQRGPAAQPAPAPPAERPAPDQDQTAAPPQTRPTTGSKPRRHRGKEVVGMMPASAPGGAAPTDGMLPPSALRSGRPGTAEESGTAPAISSPPRAYQISAPGMYDIPGPASAPPTPPGRVSAGPGSPKRLPPLRGAGSVAMPGDQ